MASRTEEDCQTDRLKDSDEKVHIETLAPDGGYGWLCVLGSFFNHFIIGGIERSSGLLYLVLEEKFEGSSASAISWIFSLNTALRQCLGPVVGILSNRFSCRTVVIFGGLLSTAGIVLSGMIPLLQFLYFSFGTLTGIGFALAYAPSVVIIGLYFSKNRGKAVGIAVSGVGVGGFTIPPLTETLLAFFGYTGAMLVLAGLSLNLCVGGALFRPLEETTKRRKFRNLDMEVEEKGGTEQSPETSKTMVEQPDELTSPREGVMNEEAVKIVPRDTCFKSFTKKYLDLSLLSDIPFLSFCLGIFLFSTAFQASLVFLPALAKDRGLTEGKIALMLSLTGGLDAFGRIFAGFLFDRKQIVPIRLFIYNLDVLLVAMVTFLCTLVWNFAGFLVISSFYGVLTGMYISQKSVVIVDLVGQKSLKSSFGLLIWFQGIGSLVGPPLAGAFRDAYGTYDEAFYFGSSVTLLAAIIMLAGNCVAWRKNRALRKSKEIQHTDSR